MGEGADEGDHEGAKGGVYAKERGGLSTQGSKEGEFLHPMEDFPGLLSKTSL